MVDPLMGLLAGVLLIVVAILIKKAPLFQKIIEGYSSDSIEENDEKEREDTEE